MNVSYSSYIDRPTKNYGSVVRLTGGGRQDDRVLVVHDELDGLSKNTRASSVARFHHTLIRHTFLEARDRQTCRSTVVLKGWNPHPILSPEHSAISSCAVIVILDITVVIFG